MVEWLTQLGIAVAITTLLGVGVGIVQWLLEREPKADPLQRLEAHVAERGLPPATHCRRNSEGRIVELVSFEDGPDSAWHWKAEVGG